MPSQSDAYVSRKNVDREPLWQNRQPRLSHLDIELTERCNNACQHCYINLPAGDTGAASRELNTQQWQDILRQAADLGALTVRITGGEPLLREDFTDLYLYARNLGLSVELFTNARLITPQLADLFARIPPRHRIEITVYGMTAESYDAAACAPGAYAQFRRGVDLLLERRIPFTVKMALLPPNRREREAFARWSASLPWSDGEPQYITTFQLRSRRDNANRNRLICSIRLNPAEAAALQIPSSERGWKNMEQFCSRFIGPAGDTLLTCGAGSSGCVDAYGRYQACMLLRTPELTYDLRQGTLQDALDNFFPKLKDLKARHPAYLERCTNCFLHGLCEQCPAYSWSEHGTLDTPVEYLCEKAHAQARLLGLLKEGEKGWEVNDWQERIRSSTIIKQVDR